MYIAGKFLIQIWRKGGNNLLNLRGGWSRWEGGKGGGKGEEERIGKKDMKRTKLHY